MITAVFLSIVLFVGTLMLHWEVLNRVTFERRNLNALRFGGVCLGLILLHFVEVGFYAGAFALGREIGIGDFTQPPVARFMDVYYFSLATFTTLGLGKALPSGHLAFLAGVEAFNGFLCISMSGSALFKLSPDIRGDGG